MLMLKIFLVTIQSIKRVRYLLLCGSIGCPHERNRLVDVVARKNQAALRLVLKIKSILENEEFPGLVLGRPEQVARVAQQHYARPFDPLAVEYNRTSIDSWVKLAYVATDLQSFFLLDCPKQKRFTESSQKTICARSPNFMNG